MPNKKYIIQRRTSYDTLTFKTGLFNSKMELFYNDKLFGEVKSENEFKELKSFDMPTGEKLNIKRITPAFLISELEIDVDGVLITQTVKQAEKEFKGIFNLILLIVGLSLGIGLISELFQIEFLLKIGFGVGSIITGLVYLGLGLWFKFKKSKIALGIFIAIYVVDFILFLVGGFQSGVNPISGIFVRGYITYALYRGFVAINRMENKN